CCFSGDRDESNGHLRTCLLERSSTIPSGVSLISCEPPALRKNEGPALLSYGFSGDTRWNQLPPSCLPACSPRSHRPLQGRRLCSPICPSRSSRTGDRSTSARIS